ncbi:MAG: hypothetical protein M3R38_38290 [Actinomycetota bacterium]|nr:hypothetical protein [Actinomycetota bacterium]
MHARIDRRFLRPEEVGERARRYIAGLLGRVDRRRNGWQMAEVIGERTDRRASSAS